MVTMQSPLDSGARVAVGVQIRALFQPAAVGLDRGRVESQPQHLLDAAGRIIGRVADAALFVEDVA